MKKIISLILSVIVLCSFSQAAFAAAQSIVINGVNTEIPADMGEIIEQDDRTFVPLRFVSENMNKRVQYNEDIKLALVVDNKYTFLIQEGNSQITRISNLGETVITEMDTMPFIKDYEGIGGRMYIPIRFMAESFGYFVDWDEGTETVTIDSE